MKTKEDILNKILPNGIAQYGAQIDRKIMEAMEEYASQSGPIRADIEGVPSDEEIENWVFKQFDIDGLDLDEMVNTQYGHLISDFKSFEKWVRDRMLSLLSSTEAKYKKELEEKEKEKEAYKKVLYEIDTLVNKGNANNYMDVLVKISASLNKLKS